MLLVGVQTNKNVFASEITEYYCQVSVKRIVTYLEKNAIDYDITLNGEEFNIEEL